MFAVPVAGRAGVRRGALGRRGVHSRSLVLLALLSTLGCVLKKTIIEERRSMRNSTGSITLVCLAGRLWTSVIKAPAPKKAATVLAVGCVKGAVGGVVGTGVGRYAGTKLARSPATKAAFRAAGTTPQGRSITIAGGCGVGAVRG